MPMLQRYHAYARATRAYGIQREAFARKPMDFIKICSDSRSQFEHDENTIVNRWINHGEYVSGPLSLTARHMGKL